MKLERAINWGQLELKLKKRSHILSSTPLGDVRKEVREKW